MSQKSFCDIEYEMRTRKTKRDEFLNIMNEIIPWSEWVAFIEPHYPTGKRGRPPIGIEKMLRMYLLQCWFALSDAGLEDSIYDSYAFRSFMGVDFIYSKVPDSTTLCKFRQLLDEHGISKKFFEAIKITLERAGCMMHGGSIVDATIIQAPSSTKNKTKTRDPEMHQTKKGNQWYFGMKCHIGVDAGSGLVHSIQTTPANIHDLVVAPCLIRPDDEFVYGDAGYLGIEKRDDVKNDAHLSKVEYRIARRKSTVEKISDSVIGFEKLMETRKASVRAKVEHPFLIVKRIFRFCKTAYRGLKKNTNRLLVLFASSNLLMCARAGRDLSPIRQILA